MNDDRYYTNEYRPVSEEAEAMETEQVLPDEPEEITEETQPQKPKKKKRKKKRYFLKFCIFLLLCAAAFFVLHSELFTVEKVVMKENFHITKDQVKEITGLKKGINLFEIHASRGEKALEEDPYIVEARIKRQLPDTVVVELDLRTPLAVLESKKGYVLVDVEGVVLDVTETMPQYTLITGITVESAKKGQAVEVKENKKYQKYLEVLERVAVADMYFKKIEIKKDALTAYATDTLYCTGATENVITSIENGTLKAIFYDLMNKEIKSGIITVGEDQYYSFKN